MACYDGHDILHVWHIPHIMMDMTYYMYDIFHILWWTYVLHIWHISHNYYDGHDLPASDIGMGMSFREWQNGNIL